MNSLVETNEYGYLIKLLALGNSGVGKTTFLYQYTDGKFNSRFTATVGIDYREKNLKYTPKSSINDKSYQTRLQLWDTAGQERYRSLIKAFFREAVGFILMFDLTNEQSFLDVRNWLSQLRNLAYCEEPDIILVGNKADQENSRVISKIRAKQFAETLSLTYIETSAITSENVTQTIHLLLDQIFKRIQQTDDKSNIPVRPLPPPLPEKQKNCAC